MYWIEVDFSNGKTLRKDADNINETYRLFSRYCRGTQPKRVKVLQVRAGNAQQQTHVYDHTGR